MERELRERFLGEIDRMGPKTLMRYKRIVGERIIERILRTLTIDELKWLYRQILKKSAGDGPIEIDLTK